MEGFDVTVTFKVEDNKITVSTENAGVDINITVVADMDKTVYAALTGDQCTVTNIRIAG